MCRYTAWTIPSATAAFSTDVDQQRTDMWASWRQFTLQHYKIAFNVYSLLRWAAFVAVFTFDCLCRTKWHMHSVTGTRVPSTIFSTKYKLK